MKNLLSQAAASALAMAGAGPNRIFGAAAIECYIDRNSTRRFRHATGSIAGQPHEHKREIARRQRQAARKAARG